MAGTTIDSLNAVTSLTAQDEVPVWDAEASGEPTKKITAQNMAASVKTLGSLVNTTEMNNALAGKQNTLTFDTTPTTGSTNPVTSGGIADAIAQSTALSTLMTASSVAGVNDNPATYTPGLYSLVGSNYNTSAWPAQNLYGILIVWDTPYYREALILGSNNALYVGHAVKSASTPAFRWIILTP